MRITHLTDTYHPRLGGIEAQVSRLAARQAAQGHEVEILTTTPAHPGDHGVSTEVEGDVVIRRLAARMPAKIPVHPRAPHYVARHLAAARPDVVHIHLGALTPSAQVSLPTVVRAGIPAVATVHSMWGAAEHGFRMVNRLVGWSRWPIVWSAVSQRAAAPLRRVVGPHADVAVIPNGIDLVEWSIDPVDRTTRPAGSALHIVAATRFASRKRVPPLLEAIRTATETLGPHRLRATIAGDGPDWAKTLVAVNDLGLAEVVSLPGRLNGAQLRTLYAQADVFAAPAIEESFGIAALEAQVAGLAIVSRAQSGLAERLTDGVDSLLVDDDDALANAFVRLAQDVTLLEAIHKHNRTTPPDVGWETVLAHVEQVYGQAKELVRS